MYLPTKILRAQFAQGRPEYNGYGVGGGEQKLKGVTSTNTGKIHKVHPPYEVRAGDLFRNGAGRGTLGSPGLMC